MGLPNLGVRVCVCCTALSSWTFHWLNHALRFLLADEDRYDHHQRGFSEVFGHGHTTKLSSAGLIYKHYGREVVSSLMGGLSKDHPDVDAVYLAVYRNFMEAIDAIDNGINPWDGNAPPKYVNNTHLSARVGNLNPAWNEDSSGKCRVCSHAVLRFELHVIAPDGCESSEK
jgi:uncharacterized UPF0160 family protein